MVENLVLLKESKENDNTINFAFQEFYTEMNWEYNCNEGKEKNFRIVDEECLIEIAKIKNIEDRENYMYILNIFTRNKNKIKEIKDKTYQNGNFEILHDSTSTAVLGEKYLDLYKLENKIRILFWMNFQESTENFKELPLELEEKKKPKIHLSSNNHRENIIYDMERISVDQILEFTTEHSLGGGELEKIRKKILDIKNGKMEEIEEPVRNELLKFINNNVFKSFGSINPKLKDIKNFRNMIAHNRIVAKDKFVKLSKKISEIEKNIDNEFGEKGLKELLELSDNKILCSRMFDNDTDLKLECVRLLYNLGFIFSEGKLVTKDEKYKYTEENKIIIEFRKIKKDKKLWLISISFEKEMENIEECFDSILRNFDENDLLLFCGLSMKYASQIYPKLNKFENYSRSLIRIISKSQGIEIENSINTKEMRDTEYRDLILLNSKKDKSIQSLDFIELSRMLEIPKCGLEPYTKQREKIFEKIKSDGVTFENLESEVKSLEHKSDKYQIIKRKIEELYEYRTIVAHSGILFKDDFEAMNRVLEETIRLVETTLNRYLKDSYQSYEGYKIKDQKFELKDEDGKIIKIEIGACDDDFISQISILLLREGQKYKNKPMLTSEINEKIFKCIINSYLFILELETLAKIIKFNCKDEINLNKLLEDDLIEQITKSEIEALIFKDMLNSEYTKYIEGREATASPH